MVISRNDYLYDSYFTAPWNTFSPVRFGDLPADDSVLVAGNQRLWSPRNLPIFSKA